MTTETTGEQTMIYVVEQFVEEKTTEVVGVRFTLEAAQALADRLIDAEQSHGPRPWATEWHEDTDSTLFDPDTTLRYWAAHRPGNSFEKAYQTYQYVHITEHPADQKDTP